MAMRDARTVVHEAAKAAKLPWCPKRYRHHVACDVWTAMLEADRAKYHAPESAGDKDVADTSAGEAQRVDIKT